MGGTVFSQKDTLASEFPEHVHVTVMGDGVLSDAIRLKGGHEVGSESQTAYKKGKFGWRQARKLKAEVRVMHL